MLQVQVFTLYPELFPGPLDTGIYTKAKKNNIWNLKTVNIRDYAVDKHKTADDTPFGGGSGMLIRPDIIASALDKNIDNFQEKIIYFSPKGKTATQLKDMTNIINAGKAADLHLPISNLIKEMYKNLVDDGLGNTDHSSLYNEIEKINKK